MAQNETGKEKPQHFLFYIFKMDREENPMPDDRAAALLQRVRCMFVKEGRCGYGTGKTY